MEGERKVVRKRVESGRKLLGWWGKIIRGAGGR